MKQAYKILIVEDEVLIADTIGRYLTRVGYQVAGPAISYEEAVELLESEKPDFALIDIRLNSHKTGIDFANYITKSSTPTPFIFLTSQTDRRFVELAKETRPAGYLTKPVRKESLLTTIEIALHNAVEDALQKVPRLTVSTGRKNLQVNTSSILYLEATHVYTKLLLHDGSEILQRKSLGAVLKSLPNDQFIQTHRGYAVNCQHVSHWDTERAYLGKAHSIPISRSRRKEVIACIEERLLAS
ncbi:DNA-binding response regulator [Lewinellaceae bacterium SD302]|nr:DNA-binding response regulator [Lewinellaceae bacterium SD302]